MLRLRRGELYLEIAQDIDADQEGSESDLFDGDGHIARVQPGHIFSKSFILQLDIVNTPMKLMK